MYTTALAITPFFSPPPPHTSFDTPHAINACLFSIITSHLRTTTTTNNNNNNNYYLPPLPPPPPPTTTTTGNSPAAVQYPIPDDLLNSDDDDDEDSEDEDEEEEDEDEEEEDNNNEPPKEQLTASKKGETGRLKGRNQRRDVVVIPEGFVDVSGDGGLLKKTLEKGSGKSIKQGSVSSLLSGKTGHHHPMPGDQVSAHYTGTLMDGRWTEPTSYRTASYPTASYPLYLLLPTTVVFVLC